jgi:hypothetical protein
MKSRLLILLMPLIFCYCNDGIAKDEKPTKEDVIAAMKKAYQYKTAAGDTYILEVHEVKIGKSAKATNPQVAEGIIDGTTVTNVRVDYSITGFINVRKQATLWVYKDDFGEWRFKATSAS